MEIPTIPVVTFLCPISSPSKTPSKPASPDKTPTSSVQSTSKPITIIPEVAPSLSTGVQFSISLPENDQSETTQVLPPINSVLSDARPLLSRLNHFKFQPDHSTVERQHRREYYTNRARRIERPRSNQHLQYNLKPEFSIWGR